MGAQATRLSDVKVKAAKLKEKDYILNDGNGLQMRVRANGTKLWNFNYIHPVTKNDQHGAWHLSRGEHGSSSKTDSRSQRPSCSGLMKPDTHLGENARQIEMSDDQTTPLLYS
ncbi:MULTISPECIES: integrase arm-type DNA-binding domain-containing protein [Pseudomonas]|uniref:integrase arm-type DNA-binding domain-containing protein n=1 Tax=Pseudomonas TaxID=286 RepID=UPI00147D9A49